MKEKLEKYLDNSYSPYSHFRVAACLIMNDGKEFYGVNVENASYGAGICAERSAILAAISNGYKGKDFNKLYIMSEADKPATPCFLCRQVFVEFMEEDMEVVCLNTNGTVNTYTVKELCPYPFGKEDLDNA